MLQKLLVTTDFSELARSAFDHALALSALDRASIELVNVIEEDVEPPSAHWFSDAIELKHLYEKAETLAHARMAALKTELGARCSAPLTTSVKRGPVVETIAEHAKQVGADLLVIATHGRTGLSHYLLGSVTERLLRSVGVPVFVTRPGNTKGAPRLKRFLVAVDKSEASARALQLAVSLAQRAQGEVEALHVWPPPGFSDTLDASFFETARGAVASDLRQFVAACRLPAGVEVVQTVVLGDVTATLQAQLAKKQPDVVVLGTHGRRGFSRWVLGSVAENVARYAPCSALIVP